MGFFRADFDFVAFHKDFCAVWVGFEVEVPLRVVRGTGSGGNDVGGAVGVGEVGDRVFHGLTACPAYGGEYEHLADFFASANPFNHWLIELAHFFCGGEFDSVGSVRRIEAHAFIVARLFGSRESNHGGHLANGPTACAFPDNKLTS